jgi:hypothetical protein
MSPKRLSTLDASFLTLESSVAHMHVGWSSVLAVPDGGDRPRPTIQALRERVAGRLDDLPWCRWRLQRAPLGLSEPRWVEDRGFDLAAHVRALAEPAEPVSYARFGQLRDALLSEPLDLSHAPWQICLVPRLEDGRVGLLGKIHHSLVDGIAALQIVNLVLDSPPDSKGMASTSFSTGPEQNAPRWAILVPAPGRPYAAHGGFSRRLARTSCRGPRTLPSTHPSAQAVRWSAIAFRGRTCAPRERAAARSMRSA